MEDIRERQKVRNALLRCGKFLVATAAVCAIGASLFLFLSPQAVTGVSGTLVRDVGGASVHLARQLSWYEAHGLTATLWLLAFSGFYLLAIPAARVEKVATLATMTVIAFALSFITGFSIGSAYLPAAIALLIGTMLFVSASLLPQP